ncbi:MAG TPA: hypothetical protein VGF94_07470 [Kofleriaceae bacterium]|jgi:hypothetical protein
MDVSPRIATVLVLVLAAVACGNHSANHGADAPADTGTSDAFAGPFSDFPAAPIIDSSGSGAPTPPNAGDLFGAAGTGATTGGPCLVEPELGALFPLNGLRPRFEVMPNGGQNVFEIRLHAQNEINDLVVYTNTTMWLLPTAIWQGINNHIVDQDIQVTIRAATTDGTTLTSPVTVGSNGTVRIAPASAAGAIVYWTPSAGTPPEGTLKGFAYGDETVAGVLTPTQASTTCIGCHASTPDGAYAAFSARGNGAGNTQIELRSVDGSDTAPAFVSASAQTLIARTEQELPAFSPAHWTTGDRMMLTVSPDLGAGKWELYWTDLEAASTTQGSGWNSVTRTGDANGVASASFSHDGTRIVYTSESDASAGVLPTHGDLYVVPWNDRAGGTAMPVAGASDPTIDEFFPAFSPDDQLIGFASFPVGQGLAYDNAMTEVSVIPTGGGSPVRLAANDPPSCSARTSPGIANSWPKWAPDVTTIGSKTYYWLAFSSHRETGTPQIFVTAVVVEGSTITTYPAFYMWNQPAGENNHTPAWDVFQIQ